MDTCVSTMVFLRFRHDVPAPITKYGCYEDLASLTDISCSICEVIITVRDAFLTCAISPKSAELSQAISNRGSECQMDHGDEDDNGHADDKVFC